LELKKDVTQLNTDNKNLSLANRILKERREEIDKKYKDATDRIRALMVTNNNITQAIIFTISKYTINHYRLQTNSLKRL